MARVPLWAYSDVTHDAHVSFVANIAYAKFEKSEKAANPFGGGEVNVYHYTHFHSLFATYGWDYEFTKKVDTLHSFFNTNVASVTSIEVVTASGVSHMPLDAFTVHDGRVLFTNTVHSIIRRNTANTGNVKFVEAA